MEIPNNNIIVTIAIPFYNAEKYLTEAIDSVLWQTYPNWELLLIDDGSTDRSLKIANEYAKKDKRISVFSDGENKNLGYRLNQIPTLVDTEYLARMDADDIMHPQRIEKQLQILLDNPEIDVLGTNSYTINEKGDVEGVRFKIESDQNLITVESFIHPTIMAKTQWFRNNLYDVQAVRVEDLELWYRTKKKADFKMLLEPLLFYREFGKDYYKKYFKANEAKDYLLKKYPNDKFWRQYFKKNIYKGVIYKCLNLFKLERILIDKRNESRLPSQNYKNYV